MKPNLFFSYVELVVKTLEQLVNHIVAGTIGTNVAQYSVADPEGGGGGLRGCNDPLI